MNEASVRCNRRSIWRGVEGSSTHSRGYTCRRSFHVARHRSQDFRVPQQHVQRRALEVLLMALRRTWLLFPNTHKERTLRAPRKMMPTLVTNKLLYNEAGARCIWPSLSRGLTLTAEASTSHEPQPRPQPFKTATLCCMYMPLIRLALSL